MALKKDDFNLKKVVDICRTEETSRQSERDLSGKPEHNILNALDNRDSPFKRTQKGKTSQMYGQEFRRKNVPFRER